MRPERLTQALLKHRALIAGLLLVASLAAAAMATQLEFEFHPQAMLEFSDEEDAFAQDFVERFGSDDNNLLVLIQADQEGGAIGEQGLELLLELRHQLRQLEGVLSTYSVIDLPRRDLAAGLGMLFNNETKPLVQDEVDDQAIKLVQENVAQSPLVRGNLVSQDGSLAMIVVALAPEYNEPIVLDPLLAEIEKLVPERVAAANRADGPSFSSHLGGLPYVRTETIRNMKNEQLLLWPLLGAIYFFILLALFRKLYLALLPLIAVGLVLLWSLGLMASIGMSVNMINNTLPTLILVVGVCNAIHVFIRIGEERERAPTPRQAITGGTAKIALASLLTTLTTAIGFAALLVAHSHILKGFGAIVAISIMLTYVAIIVVLPLMLSYRPQTLPPAPKAAPDKGQAAGQWLRRLADGLAKAPRLTLALALLVLAGSVYLGSQVPVDSRVIDAFPPDHPIVETNSLIEAELGGILPLEVDLRGPKGSFGESEQLQRVASLQADLGQIEGVISTLSVVDLLGEAGVDPQNPNQAGISAAIALIKSSQPGALERFATEDLSNIHITVRLPDHGVQQNLEVIREVETQAKAAFEGQAVQVRLTGIAYLSAVGLDTFVRDLLYSLLTATLIIFIVLVVVFRSLSVGLVALLPNLLPLATTLALMPLFGYELNTTTVVVFTISIGLAVDNTIHLIARFRAEMAQDKPLDQAIGDTFASAGRAITMSNSLLVFGFAVLLLSSFEPIRRVGILTMTTIAASLFASLLVIPAELALFGRKLVPKS